ncbi:hypothetical protein RB195_024666 [Necator americanus]|uniref:Uncharacterized protein n=1 Tax=Necator americanus TaxID=51031 RepID=A0ABR1ERB2_NECAM
MDTVTYELLKHSRDRDLQLISACVQGGFDMSLRRNRNVQRHKEALMRFKDTPAAITKESDKVWNVVSSCRNGVAYEVTINDSPCDCSEEVAVCSDQCGIAWMPVKLRRQMRAVALL